MGEAYYSPVYDEKTLQYLHEQFSRFEGECYLDHAGATLYSVEQIEKSMGDILSSLYMNPHSNTVYGNTTKEAIDNIRYIILDHFHTNQDEYSIIFTSGATAALKLVSETFLFAPKQVKSSSEYGNFVYLQDNHTSVLGMREVVAQKGANVICIDHNNAFKILQLVSNQTDSIKDQKCNSLFIYSAQCNFSGLKYPLQWIENVKNGCLNSYAGNRSNWFTLLDAASFAATNDLNLSIFKPDFVCLSFYKLFGYPTGIGALLVNNRCINVLKKLYYGGGTVNIILSSKIHCIERESVHERFEDGTVSFLSIISLQHGFKVLSDMGINNISAHVFSLVKYLYNSLLALHHQNGMPVIKLYSDTDYEDKNLQGGIISFNVLRDNGEFVGYTEVLNMAALYKIHLRTGCFCNPGACQRHLQLLDEEILNNYDAGFTCGGTKDLINGKPTGAVRISFGYMSTIEDVKTLLLMLKNCFITGNQVKMEPLWWNNFKTTVQKKFEVFSENIIKNVSNNFALDDNVLCKTNSLPHNTITFLNDNMYNINRCADSKLCKIFIYPVKSCGAYEIESSWKLCSKGLQYDREWMIVTSTGVCLTQKQETKLCMIRPFIDLNNNELILSFPGMSSIRIPLSISSYKVSNFKVCKGKICGHLVEGIDCGTEISNWLNLALGKSNLKLVRQSESITSKESNKSELSFASQSQYLLINMASILWLADKISEDSECRKNSLLHRFRGNFVIEGCEPFEEINWKVVQIGNCKFEVEAVCTRCQMVCIDQTSGEKTVEPLRTIAEQFHGKLKFGIYLVKKSDENNLIKIGDQVQYK